jgi:hypothetical protein
MSRADPFRLLLIRCIGRPGGIDAMALLRSLGNWGSPFRACAFKVVCRLLTALLLAMALPAQAELAYEPAPDIQPRVVHAGGDTCLCIWRSTRGTKSSYALSRSVDGGQTWSPPVIDPVVKDTLRGYYGHAISADAGGIVTLSEQKRLAVSYDGGISWHASTRELTYPKDEKDSHYSFGTRRREHTGALVVLPFTVRRHEPGPPSRTSTEAYFATSLDGGRTWAPPTHLEIPDPGPQAWGVGIPVVAMDGAENWLVTWCVRQTIFARASTDHAQTWSETVLLHESSTDYVDIGPVAMSKTGCWLVTWVAWPETGDYGPPGPSEVRAARSVDAGTTWEPAALLNCGHGDNAEAAGGVRAAADHAGNWVATWTDRTPGSLPETKDLDIHFAISSDDARTWTDPRPLHDNAWTDTGDDGDSSLDTDGRGNWLVVWQSSDALGARIGYDDDILFALSNDQGATWSPPEPLNTDAATDDRGMDASESFEPVIHTDGRGRWIAAWASRGHDREIHGRDAEILVSRSEDHGQTWSRPIPANVDADHDVYEDTSPRLAVNEAGTWMLTWDREDRDGFGNSIAVTRSLDHGDSWSVPVAFSPIVRYFMAHSVAAGSGGTWVLLVNDQSAGGGIYQVMAVQSEDDGATWGNVLELSGSMDSYAREGSIAASRGGQWLAVWSGDATLSFRRSTDNRHWEPVSPLDGPINAVPRLTAGEEGHWVLTGIDRYDGFEDTRRAPFLVSKDDGHTWQATIIPPSGEEDPACIAYAGEGVWIGVISPPSDFRGVTPKGLLITRSEDDAMTWSSPAAFVAGESAVEGGAAEVACDGQGACMIIWQSTRVYAPGMQEPWRILVATSLDGGRTWSAPRQLDDR